VKDAEPERPVPETANVRVPSFAGLTAVVVTPVTKPLAFTVMLGIEPPEPKVPTLELTVANVVALLTEVISPVKFGILVVDVAVPVSVPTNVDAVIIPDALIPDALIVTPLPTTILVAVALPNTGVTKVGDVANTFTPEPVSSVNTAARLALDGVVRKVATLAASPEIPVETGRSVQLVRVPELGVPNAGVVNVGDVKVLLVSVSVEDVVTTFTPSIVTTPAPPLASVVSVACPSSIEPTPNAVDVDAVRPLIGNDVQLVRVPELGVPNAGVTRVGLVANTAEPEPVSSVRAVAKLEELKEPNDVVVLTDVIAPVKLGILVVEVAVPVTAPVIAPTNDVAVITPLKLAPLPKSDVVCVVIPLKVESPLIFSEVKSLGAAATADSIVAVVVASSETIF